MNIFHSEISMHALPVNFERFSNKFYINGINFFNSHKQIKSYDRANLKKVGNFYVPTWLIFAGQVTYIYIYMYIYELMMDPTWNCLLYDSTCNHIHFLSMCPCPWT